MKYEISHSFHDLHCEWRYPFMCRLSSTIFNVAAIRMLPIALVYGHTFISMMTEFFSVWQKRELISGWTQYQSMLQLQMLIGTHVISTLYALGIKEKARIRLLRPQIVMLDLLESISHLLFQ